MPGGGSLRTRFVNLRIPAGGNETRAAEIVVDDGRIDEIVTTPGETAAGGETWVNLRDALVLPGVIDGHVHFDDPGFTHREDFGTGTSAAAAGGVTCVVDMPCTSLPPITDVDAIDIKLRTIAPKAHVDFMLWGGVSSNAMERADFLIGNDSGPIHLAGLMDKPAVCIWGPGNYERIHPVGRFVKTIIHPVPCRPCRQYRSMNCPGDERTCLDSISVEEVLEAVFSATLSRTPNALGTE